MKIQLNILFSSSEDPPSPGSQIMHVDGFPKRFREWGEDSVPFVSQDRGIWNPMENLRIAGPMSLRGVFKLHAGSFSMTTIAKIGIELSAKLEPRHARSLVHGHIDIDNVFVDFDGRQRSQELMLATPVEDDGDEWDDLDRNDATNILDNSITFGRREDPGPAFNVDLHAVAVLLLHLYLGYEWRLARPELAHNIDLCQLLEPTRRPGSDVATLHAGFRRTLAELAGVENLGNADRENEVLFHHIQRSDADGRWRYLVW